MLHKFQFLKTADTTKMLALVQNMHDVLDSIDNGSIPNKKGYSLKVLQGYLSSLIKNQRGSLTQTKPGSWCVAPDDCQMPSDARVDFIFRPTYLATATLCRCLYEFPIIALSIKGYREALEQGLLFCTYRNFEGHGFDADDGIRETLRILSIGKVTWLIDRHKDLCPELAKIIADARKTHREHPIYLDLSDKQIKLFKDISGQDYIYGSFYGTFLTKKPFNKPWEYSPWRFSYQFQKDTGHLFMEMRHKMTNNRTYGVDHKGEEIGEALIEKVFPSDFSE